MVVEIEIIDTLLFPVEVDIITHDYTFRVSESEIRVLSPCCRSANWISSRPGVSNNWQLSIGTCLNCHNMIIVPARGVKALVDQAEEFMGDWLGQIYDLLEATLIAKALSLSIDDENLLVYCRSWNERILDNQIVLGRKNQLTNERSQPTHWRKIVLF